MSILEIIGGAIVICMAITLGLCAIGVILSGGLLLTIRIIERLQKKSAGPAKSISKH